jgi:hypothetical protein
MGRETCVEQMGDELGQKVLEVHLLRENVVERGIWEQLLCGSDSNSLLGLEHDSTTLETRTDLSISKTALSTEILLCGRTT